MSTILAAFLDLLNKTEAIFFNLVEIICLQPKKLRSLLDYK